MRSPRADFHRFTPRIAASRYSLPRWPIGPVRAEEVPTTIGAPARITIGVLGLRSTGSSLRVRFWPPPQAAATTTSKHARAAGGACRIAQSRIPENDSPVYTGVREGRESAD